MKEFSSAGPYRQDILEQAEMDDRSDLDKVLRRFSGRNLLVFGDVILDRYWWGEATRLSPEAPVPVVLAQQSTARPGGAANTAANLVALGAAVDLFGVTGADPEAGELKRVLEDAGINPEFILEESARPTTTKTRVVAVHQQIVRVDHEDTGPVSEACATRVMQLAEERMHLADGIVVSDYAKGFLTPDLLARLIAIASEMRKPIFIDPKGTDLALYSNCTLLKPNRAELSILTGLPARNHEETVIAGRRLSAQMPGTRLLVTEGQDGMTLFVDAQTLDHVACPPRQVYDVTGAGDTVLATLALSVCAGATYRQAMQLSSEAASIAVGSLGTTAVSWRDLAARIRPEEFSGKLTTSTSQAGRL